MTLDDEPQHDHERSAALDAWVTAFDGEMLKSANFATTVGAMSDHGCFDVRAVVERWILANPTGEMNVARRRLVVHESLLPQPVLADAPALGETPVPEKAAVVGEASVLDEALAAPGVALVAEPIPQTPVTGELSPDIAHFHSLLQGGIPRAQLNEAFPAFRLVIDEAVAQYEAAAPILSEAQTGPSREDLDDEIRGMRQNLLDSGKRSRRRWRSGA